MSFPLRSTLPVLLLSAAALLLYGYGLESPAAPLQPDEQVLISQARTIGSTGRDGHGRVLPLFVQVDQETWLQPIPVYAAALAFAAGASDAAARWPGVLVGALDVALLFLVARRLLPREWLAVAAAALLLLTPAHYAHSRLATDAIYVVPFTLVWLLLLVEFLARPRSWLLPAATFSLGLGFFTQPAAPVTMGAYMAVTALALWLSGARSFRLYLSALGGFGLPLLCLVPWFVAHPETYPDTMGRWAIHAAHVRDPYVGLQALLNWNTLSSRASLYWGFFDPAALFLSPKPGSARPPLGDTAPLLLPMLVLMPVGLSRVSAWSRPALTVLILLGLVLAPLAASTLTVAHAIDRGLTLLPFAALLSACGAATLAESDRQWLRWAGIALLGLAALQFLGVYPALV